MPIERFEQDDVQAILTGSVEEARAFVRLISHPADLAVLFRQVDSQYWSQIFELLPDEEQQAAIIPHLSEREREIIFDSFDASKIAELLGNMDSDDAADVAAELDPAERHEALAQLPAEERQDIQTLLNFPEDSAGGLMQVERAEIPLKASIDDIQKQVRALVLDGTHVYEIYLVNTDNKLVGMLNLVDLLLHPIETKAEDIMRPLIATCHPMMDQEEVADLFRKYDLVVAPVVSDGGQLLGRIVIDDVFDVVDEEADEDALIMAGTKREELLYADEPARVALIRLPWLAVNLVGSLLSAMLIHAFGPTLEKAILVASFIPVVTAMGGNVGTQSATIIIRGLSTGRLRTDDAIKSMLRELRVGLMMGVVCGLIVGLVAGTLFAPGQWLLGGIVFLSMLAAMSIAAGLGAAAPLVLSRFNIDPAIAAGPFVTTANDILGILIYMSMVTMFITHIS